jgi:hypothetical protein
MVISNLLCHLLRGTDILALALLVAAALPFRVKYTR